MAVQLQSTMMVADHRVAVLVESTCFSQNQRPGQGFWLSKKPIAILIKHGSNIQALDCSGAPLTAGEVERLCPGAMDQIAAATQSEEQTNSH